MLFWRAHLKALTFEFTVEKVRRLEKEKKNTTTGGGGGDKSELCFPCIHLIIFDACFDTDDIFNNSKI